MPKAAHARAQLDAGLGLLCDSFQRARDFVADAAWCELDLRRRVEVIRHDLFEHSRAETFACGLGNARPASFFPSKEKLAIAVGFEQLDQLMRTSPAGFDSAPYLAAFVASSCKASAKFCAACAVNIDLGPSMITRPA